MSTKKPKPDKEPEEQPQPKESPTPEPTPEPTPTPEQEAPLPSLESIYEALQFLRQLVADHTVILDKLQDDLARKRRSVASTGKVQIKDKHTGKVYPSKNNAYQSLLKSGELKDLVDKDVFGPIPAKNTFGWYVLVREWPERFEEVPEDEQQA